MFSVDPSSTVPVPFRSSLGLTWPAASPAPLRPALLSESSQSHAAITLTLPKGKQDYIISSTTILRKLPGAFLSMQGPWRYGSHAPAQLYLPHVFACCPSLSTLSGTPWPLLSYFPACCSVSPKFSHNISSESLQLLFRNSEQKSTHLRNPVERRGHSHYITVFPKKKLLKGSSLED